MNTFMATRIYGYMRLVSVLLLALFVVVSCKKDDDKQPDNNANNNAGQTFEQRLARRTFDLVNGHRKSIRIPELKWHDAVNKQCCIHSTNMATGKIEFSHKEFEIRIANLSREINQRINRSGENILQLGEASLEAMAQRALESWLSSAGHRANIEERAFNHSALCVAKATDNTYYFTQKFVQL
jgi:uncharacterized protein YkwD